MHDPGMRTASIAVAAAALASMGALTSAGTAAAAPARCAIDAAGAPTLGPDNADPAAFAPRVTNPWFPLVPGTVLRYRGTSDGAPATEVVKVRRRTTRILGIAATAVSDRVFVDGELDEATTDWYAQDRRGTVWYLGEATATFENGRIVSREGSFRAGVGGARGGIVMPAVPRVGQEFQQELLRGEAEDRFRVADLRATVRLPSLGSRRAMRTVECTPLEPGVLDAKLYVRGVGLVAEHQIRGPGTGDRLALVSVRRPGRAAALPSGG
jgi:hypothetical protein